MVYEYVSYTHYINSMEPKKRLIRNFAIQPGYKVTDYEDILNKCYYVIVNIFLVASITFTHPLISFIILLVLDFSPSWYHFDSLAMIYDHKYWKICDVKYDLWIHVKLKRESKSEVIIIISTSLEY